MLPFSLAFDAEFVERFQREARTAAQLEHPNIIPIYRVGRSGRVIYFVMKFLRGGSLSTVLGERKKLTPPEIRRLLSEAGSALGYAAQRGIVHRDIKPDNIMFDEFGQCVLTDFGIAKAASGQKLTGTGMSIGTPHYMSPEQARAQAIDGRSDIYSLGVVAYQCLTGTVPYDGEDSFSIGYKHITEPVPDAAAGDGRRAAALRGHQADADEGSGRPIPELRGAGGLDPGTADRGGGQRARSSAATGVAASRRWRPTAREPDVGGPPLIVSQPTTPLESPLVNRRHTPRERRDVPRRVADRSVAMRRERVLMGLALGACSRCSAGLGGATTTTSREASRRGPRPPADSVRRVDGPSPRVRPAAPAPIPAARRRRPRAVTPTAGGDAPVAAARSRRRPSRRASRRHRRPWTAGASASADCRAAQPS